MLSTVHFPLTAVYEFSAIRLSIAASDAQKAPALRQMWSMVEQVKSRGTEIRPVSPTQMRISDPTFDRVMLKIDTLKAELQKTRSFNAPDIEERFAKYHEKATLEADVRELKHQLNIGDKTIFTPQLKAMQRVLRRLHFTDNDNVIQLKGRVACEINAANELVLTELIFSGLFTNMAVEPAVALLSCFVCEEAPAKDSTQDSLPPELGMPFRQLQEAARRIAIVSQESKVPTNVEDYVAKLSPVLIPVVYAWCRGASFQEVCTMTTVFEGSIIRCMRRLEELLRQLCSASKAIGNGDLEKKFATGIQKVKRDIVFAASLYL